MHPANILLSIHNNYEMKSISIYISIDCEIDTYYSVIEMNQFLSLRLNIPK